MHSVDEAFKLAANGDVFNWADAKDITSDMLKKLSPAWKEQSANCKVYMIGKPIANKNGDTPRSTSLEQNYKDSDTPPAGMRFYATSGYGPATCYCVSDGSKLGLFVNCLDLNVTTRLSK